MERNRQPQLGQFCDKNVASQRSRRKRDCNARVTSHAPSALPTTIGAAFGLSVSSSRLRSRAGGVL